MRHRLKKPERIERSGVALIYVTIMMAGLLGIVSLGVDVGHVHLVKTQLQAAADAAARYAATGLSSGVTSAQNNAVSAAANNSADGKTVSISAANDVDFGTWTGGTFTVLTGSAQSSANAIRVWCRRTAANGNPVQLSFGQVIGISTVDVTAYSIAKVAGQPYGMVGLASVSMTNGTVDSWNSSLGTYAGTQASASTFASNSNISINNGTINGSASPGVGGSVSGSSHVTGSTTPLTAALSYATPSAGSYATSNSDSNVSAYVNNGSFTLNGGTCNMAAGTYYFTDVSVTSGTLNCTGPVTIYVTGNFSSSGTITPYQNMPGNIQLLGTGSGTFQVANGTTSASIYAPSATVKFTNGTFYGAVVAGTLSITGGTLHQDSSVTFGYGSVTTVR